MENNITVDKLVTLSKAGDANAFSEIVKKYNNKIYNLAFRILQNSDDALDVMQDTFLTAYEKIDTFNFKSQFYTWLYRIATNFALMKIRSQKKFSVNEKEWEDDNKIDVIDNTKSIDLSADKILINKELKNKINNGISSLPEKYKTVFILRDIEEFSIKDTSEILDISENNVKIRLKRARAFLKKYLEEVFSDKGVNYELS